MTLCVYARVSLEHVMIDASRAAQTVQDMTLAGVSAEDQYAEIFTAVENKTAWWQAFRAHASNLHIAS